MLFVCLYSIMKRIYKPALVELETLHHQGARDQGLGRRLCDLYSCLLV